MGKVKDKILSDAAEKVRQIEEEYLYKSETMRAVYEEGVKNSSIENEHKLAMLYESEMKRLIGIRRLELRKKLLSARREMLRKLDESVKERIISDADLYKQFIEKAIRCGVKTGTEKILAAKTDSSIFTDEFIKQLNRTASEKIGRECSLRLADDYIEIEAGVHLRSGRENFNAAIDVSVAASADEHEPELAVMLFEGDN